MRNSCLALLPLAFALGAMGAAPPVDADADVRQLVWRLGDDDFDAREDATRRLLVMPHAEPALRRATHSDDPERAARARKVLKTFVARRVAAQRERLRVDVRSGAAGTLAERIVAWEAAADDERRWQAPLSFFHQILDRHELHHDRLSALRLPTRSFEAHVKKYSPGVRSSASLLEVSATHEVETIRMFASGVNVRSNGIPISSVLVATESVKSGNLLNSFVLCGGDVLASNSVFVSVVVCEGDFVAEKALVGSNVFARGDVVCRQGAWKCRIFAGGDVRAGNLSKFEDCTIRAGGKVSLHSSSDLRPSKIEQGATVDFGPVRFFETRRLGVETARADSGVCVSALDPSKSFARAGLRQGDLIRRGDGLPIGTVEAFRRHIRRRAAVEGFTLLTAQREGKPLDLLVRLD